MYRVVKVNVQNETKVKTVIYRGVMLLSLSSVVDVRVKVSTVSVGKEGVANLQPLADVLHNVLQRLELLKLLVADLQLKLLLNQIVDVVVGGNVRVGHQILQNAVFEVVRVAVDWLGGVVSRSARVAVAVLVVDLREDDVEDVVHAFIDVFQRRGGGRGEGRRARSGKGEARRRGGSSHLRSGPPFDGVQEAANGGGRGDQLSSDHFEVW